MAAGSWLGSSRMGNEVRFLFDDSISRYDLSTRSWMSPFSLPRSGAGAMAADGAGTVIAYGSSIYLGSADFSGQAFLATASDPVQSLFLDGNLVIATHSTTQAGKVTLFDRATGVVLSTSSYNLPFTGSSCVSGKNLLFACSQRSTSAAPATLMKASYRDAGIVTEYTSRPESGTLASARTWVSQDGKCLISASGAVYRCADLALLGDMQGLVTDVAFNGDVMVVLSGSELTSYDRFIVEKGRTAAGSSSGRNVYLDAASAFVFSPTPGDPAVSIVPLSSINAPAPGTAARPEELIYQPERIFTDRDGNLLLYSRTWNAVLRWSPSDRRYTGYFPLEDLPLDMTYRPESGEIYYITAADQIVRKLGLAQPDQAAIAVTTLDFRPATICATAGTLFISGTRGWMGIHSCFDAAGAPLWLRDDLYYEGVTSPQWDNVRRRLYFYGSSGFYYDSIDSAGQITSSPIPVSTNPLPRSGLFRVSPAGDQVLFGNGMVQNASGNFERAGVLSTDVVDAAWSGSKLVTIRPSGGASQVQSWQGKGFSRDSVSLSLKGTPLGVVNTASGLVAITSAEGMPSFTLLNDGLGKEFTSPVRPAAPADLRFTGKTDTSISLQWQDRSDNEDGFLVEYRIPGRSWLAGPVAGPGVENVTVDGLTSEMTYEFRIFAIAGNLVSAALPAITVNTLEVPDQPTGEPYRLTATRITYHSISLSWEDHATNEIAFLLYRSTSPTVLGTARTLPAGTTSFIDSEVSLGTTYYYRVAASGGLSGGELSAPLMAKTPSSTNVPAKVTVFTAVVAMPDALQLDWVDAATNEDNYVVERATDIYGVWTTVATLPANSVRYLDTSAAREVTYLYRIRAVNVQGSSLSSTVSISLPYVNGTFTGNWKQSGGICYFLLTRPNRIERFDLSTRAWLADIPLESQGSALWVDDLGIYVASDREILRFSLSGGAPVVIANSAIPVSTIFTVGNVLCFGGSRSEYASFDRSSGKLLSVVPSIESGAGFSVSSTLGRAYFRINDTRMSTRVWDVGASGFQGRVLGQWSTTRSSLEGASTYLSPDQSRLMDEFGIVRSASSFEILGSIGSGFLDLSFLPDGRLLVLRSDRIELLDSSYRLTASRLLPSRAMAIASSGNDAVVVFRDGTQSHGFRAESFPLGSLIDLSTVPALNARGLAFTPDDILTDKRGNLLLVSKANSQVFRWSPTLKDYLAPIPLPGPPGAATYSAGEDSLYLSTPDQRVWKVKLGGSNPVLENPCNLLDVPLGLVRTGDYFYAVFPTGTEIYTSSGQMLSHLNHLGSGSSIVAVNAWDAGKRRVYGFDDYAGSVLTYRAVSLAGVLSGAPTSVSISSLNGKRFIAIAPDGSKVMVSSGQIFTSELVAVGTLPLADSVSGIFVDSRILTLHPSGANTVLRSWDASSRSLLATLPELPGSPLRILPLSDGRLGVVTLDAGVPRYFTLTAGLVIESDSPQISSTGAMIFNPATGLYEQTIVVINGMTAVDGLEFTVSNMAEGVRLYNGGSSAAGTAGISRLVPLQPGESITIQLQFYVPAGTLPPAPVIQIETGVASNQNDAGFAIRSIGMVAGRPRLEFNSEPQAHYRVEYSSDMLQWQICSYGIVAAGTRLAWQDDGPPFTSSIPTGRRFYRVVREAP